MHLRLKLADDRVTNARAARQPRDCSCSRLLHPMQYPAEFSVGVNAWAAPKRALVSDHVAFSQVRLCASDRGHQ